MPYRSFYYAFIHDPGLYTFFWLFVICKSVFYTLQETFENILQLFWKFLLLLTNPFVLLLTHPLKSFITFTTVLKPFPTRSCDAYILCVVDYWKLTLKVILQTFTHPLSSIHAPNKLQNFIFRERSWITSGNRWERGEWWRGQGLWNRPQGCVKIVTSN